MDPLFWVATMAPTLYSFIASHWAIHRRVGRALDADAQAGWRRLPLRGRLRLRWTVRRARAVEDPKLAPLAARVARAELDIIDQPRAVPKLLAFAAVTAALGALAVFTIEGIYAAMLFVFCVFLLWSAACQAPLVRCLERGAEENERLASAQPGG